MSGIYAAGLISACRKEQLDEASAARCYEKWLRAWYTHDVMRLTELHAQDFSPPKQPTRFSKPLNPLPQATVPLRQASKQGVHNGAGTLNFVRLLPPGETSWH